MDTRKTFNTMEELLSITRFIYQQKQQAGLLVDHDGLTRLSGEILSIEENTDIRKTVIRLSGSYAIELNNIVAINGIFHADYSEC